MFSFTLQRGKKASKALWHARVFALFISFNGGRRMREDNRCFPSSSSALSRGDERKTMRFRRERAKQQTPSR